MKTTQLFKLTMIYLFTLAAQSAASATTHLTYHYRNSPITTTSSGKDWASFRQDEGGEELNFSLRDDIDHQCAELISSATSMDPTGRPDGKSNRERQILTWADSFASAQADGVTKYSAKNLRQCHIIARDFANRTNFKAPQGNSVTFKRIDQLGIEKDNRRVVFIDESIPARVFVEFPSGSFSTSLLHCVKQAVNVMNSTREHDGSLTISGPFTLDADNTLHVSATALQGCGVSR